MLQRAQDKCTYTDPMRNLRRVPHMSFLLAFPVNVTVNQPCEGGFRFVCMELFVKRGSVSKVGNVNWALTIWPKSNCPVNHPEDKGSSFMVLGPDQRGIF